LDNSNPELNHCFFTSHNLVLDKRLGSRDFAFGAVVIPSLPTRLTVPSLDKGGGRSQPSFVKTVIGTIHLWRPHRGEGVRRTHPVEGSAPCGRSHRKIRTHWRHPVFSCKEVGVFWTRISSL